MPLGSGLSSSAALGVAVTCAIDRAQGLRLDGREIATLAHRGESEILGVGCGIMDQFASALGQRDHALRLDCRSLEITPIPLADGELRMLIAQSGVKHAVASPPWPRRAGRGSPPGKRPHFAISVPAIFLPWRRRSPRSSFGEPGT